MTRNPEHHLLRNPKGKPRKPPVYPVFLPHAGCPFQCVYCDQSAVTGTRDRSLDVDPAEVCRQVDGLAERSRAASRPGEIAFYGGTFTGLWSDALVAILGCAGRHVLEGAFTGIRFSTRPDHMATDTVRILRGYPVTTVELGVQSLDDAVLAASRRGYASREVREAAARIRSEGWHLGIQLMPGLPGDDRARFLGTVRAALDLSPAFLRIYPTLVLDGTRLADWYRSGSYRPLDLTEAVSWCAEALELCREAGVPVARMGLLDQPELQKPGAVLAGPHHSAFGALVRSRWWLDRIDREIAAPIRGEETGRNLVVRVPPNAVSDVCGHRRSNVLSWRRHTGISDVTVLQDPGIAPWHFSLEWE